jgi:hypothetical protein
MKNPKTLLLIIVVVLVLSLVFLTGDQLSASACTISLGKKLKFDMELSPKVPLFKTAKDGYFYPGGPKITKNLEVRNVGDCPFRICGLSCSFHGDTHLATGLRIRIVEFGRGHFDKSSLLYTGLVSDLGYSVRVQGKMEVSQRESVFLQITVWMPENAGDEYQGLCMMADIAVTVYSLNCNEGGRH